MATAENISRATEVFFAEMRQNRCQFAARQQGCTSNLPTMETTTHTRHRPPVLLTGLQPDPRRLAETAEAVLPTARRRAAQREIMSWEGYAPTQLLSLPGLAGRLRVSSLWCKDEGSRF